MKIQYKTITIVTKKSKFPQIYSGEYLIAEIHDDYVAFIDKLEMEYCFDELKDLSMAICMYQDRVSS